jgi:hypothetical protein
MSHPHRSLLVPVVFLSLLATSFAADPPLPIPECTKDDVRRILLAQDWANITLIAVVNGLNREKIAAPSLCHALAFASREGRWENLKVDLYYYRDLGWFTYESSPQLFRVWTREGYREIKPGFGF